MKCSWWVKVDTLAGLTGFLGIRPCPVSPVAAGDSALIAGTIILDGLTWLTAKDGLTWSQRQAVIALQIIIDKLANRQSTPAYFENSIRNMHLIPAHSLAKKIGTWVRQAWGLILGRQANHYLARKASNRNHLPTSGEEYEAFDHMTNCGNYV
eukprot:1778738-Heterocapsa_arctica.AAC.1